MKQLFRAIGQLSQSQNQIHNSKNTSPQNYLKNAQHKSVSRVVGQMSVTCYRQANVLIVCPSLSVSCLVGTHKHKMKILN